jgi:flagellar protein FliS
MPRSATQKYQAQQVMSASPAKLVAMLYDKAISCLHEAIRAIEAGEIEARWQANKRAMEIINHLCLTLDLEQGGEIANNLDQLYRFILNRLPEVDLRNNPAPAKDAIGLLEPLRRSWHTLADQTDETAARSQGQAQRPAQTGDGRAPSGGEAPTAVVLSA